MKTIIITGASDGLGKALAEIVLKNGNKAICVSRSKCDLKGIENIVCDLAEPKQIDKAVAEIKAKFPKFDALVNCAGNISVQKPNAITYDEMERVMKVNSLAPMYLTSKLFDLIKQNEADIMNVGSTVGLKGYPDQCTYGTSKWAIRGTSINYQMELAKTRCRVTQFNPGGMNTPFWDKYNGTKIQDPENWMKPSDVAQFMWQILNLPKQMEVLEVSVGRKTK